MARGLVLTVFVALVLALVHASTGAPTQSAPMPPRAVLAAMADGRACWLETDYALRAGNVNATRSEWLCGGAR